MDQPNKDYARLFAEKAEKLDELRRRKPGQKHYKRSLMAFLEADAAAQKAILAHVQRLGERAAPSGEPPRPGPSPAGR